ncbi:peptide deformylase [Cryobacterium sp. MP_M5]|uniref:peptide deformylase n=1 Tax=unclassified Cryobacterium TaxID=2649013 RepID=UPI0018C96D01|nr:MULTISPECIES: peptide deformylase [unclassified Cryobacterium]MBG6058281.1 peptide deformylase [Cryobacterium sp. MP_M3]MEC5177688.1 peptide deformylase [Cryobacterium sp. MP_M5]
MAVRAIVISGDPVLHSPAASVEEFDDDLRVLVQDMYETMDAAPGVGLAAPQVGVPLRLFTYSYLDDDDRSWRGVAINPELWITPVPAGEADEDEDVEGCLSYPGERFPLLRSPSAILRAVDLDQKPFEIHAEGWLARIFQHEYDHLDGTLYVDRLEHFYAKIATKVTRKRGWGVPDLSWVPGVDNLED